MTDFAALSMEKDAAFNPSLAELLHCIALYSETPPQEDLLKHNEKDGMLLLFIPGGRGKLPSGQQSDTQIEVEVAPFYLAMTLVTNQQFHRFYQVDHRRAPFERRLRWLPGTQVAEHPAAPVTGITWEEACAYCDWVGGKLPSETQWLWATFGPRPPLHDALPMRETNGERKVPLRKPAELNAWWPAGTGFFGSFQMGGNKLEWCRDHYSVEDAESPRRILRGGFHINSRHRQLSEETQTRSSDISFRYVIECEPRQTQD